MMMMMMMTLKRNLEHVLNRDIDSSDVGKYHWKKTIASLGLVDQSTVKKCSSDQITNMV